MTLPTKEVLINIRLKPVTREEFRVAAGLKGSTMSGLLHQFIIRTIREEKVREPEAFIDLPTGPSGPFNIDSEPVHRHDPDAMIMAEAKLTPEVPKKPRKNQTGTDDPKR